MWLFKKNNELVIEGSGNIRIDVELTLSSLPLRIGIVGPMVEDLRVKYFDSISKDKKIVKVVKKVLMKRTKKFANALKEELDSDREIYYV